MHFEFSVFEWSDFIRRKWKVSQISRKNFIVVREYANIVMFQSNDRPVRMYD